MGGEKPPALESEDETTVTEEDEKESEGEPTEDEESIPLRGKRTSARKKTFVKPQPKQEEKELAVKKKVVKKAQWQNWEHVKRAYVPEGGANRAQFEELGWKKRSEFIEKLRTHYQKTTAEYRVRRLPFLDLRNFGLYLQNGRFDSITGGKKSAPEEPENGTENGCNENGANSNEAKNNNSHNHKKKKQQSKWATSSDESFMVGNRVSFVPSPTPVRPMIQHRRQDGKFFLVDVDNDYEEWVDLTQSHVNEYTEVVWAKVKGYSWWPAQVIQEVKMGKITRRPGLLQVEFCDTKEVNNVKYANIRPFEGGMLAENKDKNKQVTKAAMKEAMRLWEEHTHNVANFERKRKSTLMQAARDNTSPASLLQTKIKVTLFFTHTPSSFSMAISSSPCFSPLSCSPSFPLFLSFPLSFPLSSLFSRQNAR